MIEGVCCPIHTDFRLGLRLWHRGRQGKLSMEELLEDYFPGRKPENWEAAAEGIRRFFLRKDAPAEQEAAGPQAYDLMRDADAICGGFLEKYGIHLLRPETELHWWVFLALTEGLFVPNLAGRVELRTMSLQGLSPERRKTVLALRRQYAIEEETLAEHMARLEQAGKETAHGRRNSSH